MQPEAIFRNHSEIRALRWMRENVSRSQVTFSAYQTGGIIPALANTPVFIGHRYETIAFEQKAALVELFFGTNTDDAWRRNLLNDHRIKYVWWGAEERRLGNY